VAIVKREQVEGLLREALRKIERVRVQVDAAAGDPNAVRVLDCAVAHLTAWGEAVAALLPEPRAKVPA
jgi:hypothetical protein